MAVYCLTIQYDGRRYNGWQRQVNTPNTIQEKLEALLTRIYDIPVEINGSGRTDAGVHALGQTASFRVPNHRDLYPASQLTPLINQYLPEDIRILKTEQKGDRFHARLLANGKQYIYRIDNGEIPDVFARRYCHHIPQPLDLEAMKQAGRLLTGTHEFKSFCDNKRMKKSTRRTIYSIDFIIEGNFLTIRYYGNGFLYHMVRLLTGTLLEIGLHHKVPKSVVQILEAMDRSAAGPLAPPQGLFLEKVFYD